MTRTRHGTSTHIRHHCSFGVVVHYRRVISCPKGSGKNQRVYRHEGYPLPWAPGINTLGNQKMRKSDQQHHLGLDFGCSIVDRLIAA